MFAMLSTDGMAYASSMFRCSCRGPSFCFKLFWFINLLHILLKKLETKKKIKLFIPFDLRMPFLTGKKKHGTPGMIEFSKHGDSDNMSIC